MSLTGGLEIRGRKPTKRWLGLRSERQAAPESAMLANLQDDEVLVEAQQPAISETGTAIQETEAEQVHVDKPQRGPERQPGEQLLERPPAARPVGK